MSQQFIPLFLDLGFKLELTEVPGKVLAKCTKIGPNIKRHLFYYAYRNEEQRIASLQRNFEMLKKRSEEKADRVKRMKEARQNMKHGFEMGMILYNSWGYEQTNIDFYQVVEVKPKSIVIREIAQENVLGSSEGYSSMSAFVRPKENEFIGEELLKPITIRVWNEKPVYSIKARHGSFSIYTKEERGVYASYYA